MFDCSIVELKDSNAGLLNCRGKSAHKSNGLVRSCLAALICGSAFLALPALSAPTQPAISTRNAYSCSQINLAWSPSSDTGNQTITYNVLRNGTVVRSGLSSTLWNDTGLAPLTSYSYTVQAVDGKGTTTSAAVLIFTPACPAQNHPPGPVRITARNGNVELNWTGTAGVRYQAQCSTNFGAPWQPVDAPT